MLFKEHRLAQQKHHTALSIKIHKSQFCNLLGGKNLCESAAPIYKLGYNRAMLSKNPPRASSPRLSCFCLCATLVCALFVSACSGVEVRRPTEEETLSAEDQRDRRGGKIGRAGKPDDPARTLFSFGKKKKKKAQNNALAASASLNTNPYLWQGALQTIAFMPLLSSDFAGGVIATDWYSPPEVPRRRYKITVRITGAAFRADALEAAVFSQNLRNGQWRDEITSSETVRQIEETMLTRARDLLRDANL